MSERSSVTVASPAKVNLALSVGPPGPDGMHPIASWMVTVDLHDELTLTRLDDDSRSAFAREWAPDARRRSEIDWSITRDLAYRAHQALELRFGRDLPVRVKVEKRIPVGGGLGGGSSNAAAMLRGMNELFGLGLDPEELAEIGGSLGSDVPFLIRGGSALVEGLGERLLHQDQVPEIHMALAFPHSKCPTGPVYKAFDRLRPNAALETQRVRDLLNAPVDMHRAPFNDLAPPAFDVEPALADDVEEVMALVERPVHLSGSGSTLFVLCAGRLEADLLAQTITSRLSIPAVAVQTTSLPPIRA